MEVCIGIAGTEVAENDGACTETNNCATVAGVQISKDTNAAEVHTPPIGPVSVEQPDSIAQDIPPHLLDLLEDHSTVLL